MINYSISWSSGPTEAVAPKPADPLARGVAAHRQGRLDQAMAYYAHALQVRPNRALASYNLGVAQMDVGLGLVATPFLMRAVMLQPLSETYGYALLYVLIRSGRLAEVGRLIAEYAAQGLEAEPLARWRGWLDAEGAGAGQALEAPGCIEPAGEPADPEPPAPRVSAPHPSMQAPFEQALRDYQSGQMEVLLDRLDGWLSAQPDWGEGHHLRGLGALALGRAEQAAAALTRASELLAGRAEVWDHLALARARLGDELGVREAFERSLSLGPLRAETWSNAANAAFARGQLGQAYQYAIEAVRLKPELQEASDCLLRAASQLDADETIRTGSVDGDGFLPKAVAVAKAAVQGPEQALSLASRLGRIGRRGDVVEVLEDSLTRFGDRPPELLARLAFNQRYVCDWRQWDERSSVLRERVREAAANGLTPFSALSLPGLSSADHLRIARAWAARHSAWAADEPALQPAPSKDAGSRLRVGYLSADFQEHATAYLAASVLERHDRARFETFAYSIGPEDDSPMRRRLRAAFEHFVDIRSLSHAEAAQRIRDDGIDILVDMKGYTRDSRPEILALRPCPLQVSWLGFPGTLGAPFIDYLVVDPIVVPPEHGPHYAEALAYMPVAYAPVDDRRQVAATPARTAAGLPEHGLVFCCFNDPYKITPEMFDCWCDLLQATPGSVLWLYAKYQGVADNLLGEAAARGIGADRLVFAERLPQSEHLARLALADLFLDTNPVNAHTTASDALWVGVPVLTLIGPTFVSRVAASLLTAVGLPQLVAAGLEEYRARAIELATNPALLGSTRERLARARETSAFFDAGRFAADLESLYRRMWERHAKGLPPGRLEPATVA